MHNCKACPGDGEVCYGRGHCFDDEAAKALPELFGPAVARGNGSCTCNERHFYGMDEDGRSVCSDGTCPAGTEEKDGKCQVCEAGSHTCQRCESGQVSGPGSSSCWTCEHLLIHARPDDMKQTCLIAIADVFLALISWITSSCFCFLLLLGFWGAFQIADVSASGSKLVITTSMWHFLHRDRGWTTVTFVATGVPELEKQEHTWTVTALNTGQMLLNSDQKIETPVDTSMGLVRMKFPHPFLSTGMWNRPLICWCLLFFIATMACMSQLKWPAGEEWRESAYWVCTFSNSQWHIKEELGNDNVEESSFYWALRSRECMGTAMIIDEHVLPLTRKWCIFELYQTIHLSQSAHFRGLLLCTSTGILQEGKAGTDIAVAVARTAKEIDTRSAKATSEKDEKMINSYIENMPGGFDAMNRFVQETIGSALEASHLHFEKTYKDLMRDLAKGISVGPSSSSSANPTLLTSKPQMIGKATTN
eukprot:s59_g67.t1